jgi:MGT family glycosyltransferase
MAQLLVCAVPNPGHVSPMLAVSRHLSAAGHTIIFYTAEVFRSKVEASGFEFFSLPGKANYNYLRQDEHFPERNSVPPGPEWLNLAVRAMFSEPLVDQHRGLEEILRIRSIDLIVIDTLFFGVFPLLLGPRSKRPPVVCCGVNPMLLTGVDAGPNAPPARTAAERQNAQQANRQFLETFEPFTVLMNEKLREVGSPLLPAPPFDCVYTLPDLVLQFGISQFEFAPSDRPSTVHFVGPILPKATERFEEPSWWRDLDSGRPVVLVTQGTLANTDLKELIEPTLAALAGEDALVIAATGSTDAAISAVPRNARVATFIPFDRLLPKVNVFVTNGGYGGVSQAIAAGVPVVAAGLTEDKGFVSQRVAWSGAGINLQTSRPTESQIRTAVLEALSNDSYRRKAGVLCQEMARHNALEAVAKAVDSLLPKRVPAELSAALSVSSRIDYE